MTRLEEIKARIREWEHEMPEDMPEDVADTCSKLSGRDEAWLIARVEALEGELFTLRHDAIEDLAAALLSEQRERVRAERAEAERDVLAARVEALEEAINDALGAFGEMRPPPRDVALQIRDIENKLDAALRGKGGDDEIARVD